MLELTDPRNTDGVTRWTFSLEVSGAEVPGVLWAPEGATGPRPLVLMGHGGSQHKKTAGIASRAQTYAREFGYATVAIDAPNHGDRISRQDAEAFSRDVGARVRGEAPADWTVEQMTQMRERHAKAIPEWNAALEAVQALDFIGSRGPVGYWGVSMGTAIGVPFVAQQPKVTAAVFGLAGLRVGAEDLKAAAERITIPIEFVFQWEDAVAPREAGLALFNAFASREKTMHINPGGHMEIPAFEGASWERFFRRHLSGEGASGVLRAA